MIYQAYKTKRFQNATKVVILQAKQIIEEYAEQGYDLTLRQLYYKFVAKDIFPDDRVWIQIPGTNRWRRDPNGTKNAEPNYSWLGSILNDARLAGYIPWDAIVDRTREEEMNSHWNAPSDIISSAAQSYKIDTREDQDNYIEVWVEKEALVGVIGRCCKDLDVTFMACRGYVSQSAMWRASIRFLQQEKLGKRCYILHLGDHDPSGIDMTRDIQDRLWMFGTDVQVNRIALNMDQIEELNPPPNPAKITDSRCDKYIEEYGELSWELDALEPAYIENLIREAEDELTDQGVRSRAIQIQENQRDLLNRASDRWNDIVQMLEDE